MISLRTKQASRHHLPRFEDRPNQVGMSLAIYCVDYWRLAAMNSRAWLMKEVSYAYAIKTGDESAECCASGGGIQGRRLSAFSLLAQCQHLRQSAYKTRVMKQPPCI